MDCLYHIRLMRPLNHSCFTIQLILLIILIDSLRHFYKILEEIWSCQCRMSSFDKDVIDVVIKELKSIRKAL